MRKLKFRVWNPKYNSWCGKSRDDWWLGLEYNTGKLVCVVDGKITDAPDYLIPMQFTGITDKNGKELYEGDKFDMTQRLDDFETFGEVIWNKEDSCWGYLHNDGSDTEQGNLMDLNTKELVIIGNIYEQ